VSGNGTVALPGARLREITVGLWVGLAILALVLFAVLYDQGWLLRPFLGRAAEAGDQLHELFHDGRNLLGVPCH